MIRLLAIIYLLLNLLPLRAQVQYFDRAYDFDLRAEILSDIIQTDDGYISVGVSGYLNDRLGLIMKTSFNGDTLWTTLFGLQNEWNECRSIIKKSNGHYLVATTRRTSSIYSFRLVTSDQNGIIINTQDYSNNGSEIVKKIIPTSDNGYLLAGISILSPNQEAQFHIKKVDSAGNLIWEKDHGQSNTYENGYDVIETADGGFIITGSKLYFGSNNNQDLYIVRTDSAGNFLWDKTYGGQYYDGGRGIIRSKEGGYLLYSFKRLDEDTPHGWLMKIDTLGNVEWERTYSEGSGFLGSIYGARQLLDSSYILIGHGLFSFTKTFGWIFKTDINGNKLWSRTYNPNPAYHSYFYSFDTTADGGFIASGSTHPYTQDGWIVKMDEYGCDTAGCHLSDTTIGIPGLDPSQHWEMNIYPNPNTGYFTLSVTAPDNFSGEMDADIFNISGQMIWNRKIYISEGKNEEQLEISAPAGIYFLRIRSGLDTVIQKFVIE